MKRKELIAALIKTLVIGVVSLAFLLPLVWMMTSSVKSTNEVFSVNWKWFPEVWRWDNTSPCGPTPMCPCSMRT